MIKIKTSRIELTEDSTVFSKSLVICEKICPNRSFSRLANVPDFSNFILSENFGELLNIYKSIETGLAFCRRAMVFSPCTTIK